MCAGFVMNPSARYEREVLARRLVRDLAREPLVERDRVELARARMLPRRLGVELLRERVELRVRLLERALDGRAQAVIVARVRCARAALVDVDVVAVAVRREELDPELGEQRVQPRLVRRDPLAAELVRLAADLGVPEPAADAVARLEDDDVAALRDEPTRRGEPGDAGPHDDRRRPRSGGRPCLASQRRCGCRAPGAHGTLHVAGDPLVRAADVERRIVRSVERPDAQHVPRPPVRRVAARERIERPEPQEGARDAPRRRRTCARAPRTEPEGDAPRPSRQATARAPAVRAPRARPRAAATSRRAGALPRRARSRRGRPTPSGRTR